MPEAARIGIVLCFAAVGTLLLLHYRVGLGYAGPHDVLRRLFYVPVIIAAILGGLRAGLIAAGMAGLAYLPHLHQLSQAGFRILDHGLELVLLPLVGGLVGAFADSRRRAEDYAVERGRLAALGEIGLGVMAQIEGPLAAIEGQSETLDMVGELRRNDATRLSARKIREEAARMRRLLADLRALKHSAARQPGIVDLAAVVRNIACDLETRRASRAQIIFTGGPDRPAVRADSRGVAYALRTLLFSLSEAVPSPGRLEIGFLETPAAAIVEIGVRLDEADVPDLEEVLCAVFGADPRDYHFEQAICTRLLLAGGATLDFDQKSPRHVVVRLRFPADGVRTRKHQEVRMVGSPTLWPRVLVPYHRRKP